jgi:hypothetical protein
MLVFRHLAESGEFGRAARGVGIQHLGATRFSAMPFPLPPTAEQNRIVAEAASRLADSRAQRHAVQASLGHFPATRREIWAAAVSGRLAIQDPKDESAKDLLARLGPPVEPARPLPEATEKENAVTKQPPRKSRNAEAIKPLQTVLAEAGHAVTLPDLFVSAGYDRDSIGDVERFYLELRDDAGRTIKSVDETSENTMMGLRDAS